MSHFNTSFEPILLPGHTARLFQSPTSFFDIKVVAVGSLAVHRHDFGTLTADLLDQDCTHLDMEKGECAQYRYVIRGAFDVHLQHPAGVDQYRTQGSNKATRTQAFRMQPWAFDNLESDAVKDAYWRLSEFIVVEDKTPRFDIYPYAPAAQIEAHVDFFGYRFALELLPPGEHGKVDIWVNNWPSSKSLTR